MFFFFLCYYNYYRLLTTIIERLLKTDMFEDKGLRKDQQVISLSLLNFISF